MEAHRRAVNRCGTSPGVTMIELLVVILILAIVSAIAAPSYIKSVEQTKADTAIAAVKMIADANRQYYLANGVYASGIVNDAGPNCCVNWVSCRSDACDRTQPQANQDPKCTNACNLIACGYMAQQDWANNPYVSAAEIPGDTTNAGSDCSLLGATPGVGNIAACAHRRPKSQTNGTDQTPYKDWAYMVDPNGKILTVNGAPSPMN